MTSSAPLDSENFIDEQLGVSSFEPHLTTSIVYPDFSLKKNASEKFAMFPVDQVEERYEPLPLIPDAAVTVNSSCDNVSETAFFTRTRATGLPATTLFRSSLYDEGSLLTLISTMVCFEKWVGTTTLSVHSFMYLRAGRGTGPPCMQFRVRSVSNFHLIGDGKASYTMTFRFDEKDLYPHGRGGPHPESGSWLALLDRLLKRSCDRSYSHVRLHLKMARQEDPRSPQAFLPLRIGNWTALLKTKINDVDASTLPSEDGTCAVCTEVFDNKTTTAVKLKDCSHIICHACLFEWVASSGFKKATCTHCRAKIFSDKEELKHLSSGLVNGVYEYDFDYSEFGNFERSCADLDMHHAKDGRIDIQFNAGLLIQILNIIAAGTLESREDASMPEFLHPLGFQEWDIAVATFERAAHLRHGTWGRIDGIFSFFLHQAWRAFVEEFARRGMEQYTNGNDRWDVECDLLNAKCLCIRPGFKEAYERILSRVLRFFVVRQCRCAPGMHKHGLRDYYNPDSVYSANDTDNDGNGGGEDVEMTDSCW
jgi:hypothetical protein